MPAPPPRRAGPARAGGTLVALLVLLLLALAPAAGAQPPASTSAAEAVQDVRELVDGFARQADGLERRVGRRDRARPGPALSENEVLAIAETSEEARSWIEDHPVTRTTPEFDRDERRHTVWYVATDADGGETVEAQVFIADETGEITEVRTGPQVAWMMARGYEGAFGRAINRPAIWLTLCALFLLPLLRVRRIVSWRTLDLLVLLSFSVSLIWFNRGEIFTSVPLAYPPMAYLGLRLAWIGGTRMRRAPVAVPGGAAEDTGAGAGDHGAAPAFRGWAPTWVLVTALILALALRYGLNAFDSNVIDVGYAGVIGADLIMEGTTPYGNFPDDCGRCDTYGPLNYLAYIPFEVAQPWSGTWDNLPAAHGAATTFDLLCVAGMLMLGWRLGGLRLGAALALGWAAFPFSGYTLATNANDALVAAALIWGLVVATRPLLRGVMLGLAVATKFGPAILLLLWARAPLPRPARGRGGLPAVVRYAGGLLAAAAFAALVWLVPLQAFRPWTGTVITDVPVYQRVADDIASGVLPYR
ncbi:MAG TPA: glycosyltransferase 87 family protein, partial [Miltoncostaeaceae bacterium]|nr:glycosyltransferase 87 family protein [Miltoncostaeaceae bacterium]